jgi:hypothetical protein
MRCPAGILVLNAREGGPAWKSGIRGTSRDEYGRLVLGDIITAINGKNVRNSSDLYRMLDKALVSLCGWGMWLVLGRRWCLLGGLLGGTIQGGSAVVVPGLMPCMWLAAAAAAAGRGLSGH